MSTFAGIEFEQAKNEYSSEVEERFGNTDAYAEHKQKTAGYKKEDWNKVCEGMNAIIAEFAELNAQDRKPTDKTAQEIANKLQDFITETQYTCTKEILASLGEMYVADQRFKKNINKHGEKTAEFMSEAIRAYCEA